MWEARKRLESRPLSTDRGGRLAQTGGMDGVPIAISHSPLNPGARMNLCGGEYSD